MSLFAIRGTKPSARALWRICNCIHPIIYAFARSHYSIVSGYRHRSEALYFDDTCLADQWQREVYEFAAELMAVRSLGRVYDVGCGSGFKLVKYLGDYETVGFDVEPTVRFLMEEYPDRSWAECQLSDRSLAPADLVICADVIEHVVNPDELLEFIKHIASSLVVISTPDRSLFYGNSSPHLYGPPLNPHHIREWNFSEFHRYIGEHFSIINHVISNYSQGTQMILCQNSHPR